MRFNLVLSIKVILIGDKKSMWFGLVRLTFKKLSEPNQIKQMRFELVRLVRFFKQYNFFSTLKSSLKGKTLYFHQCFIFHPTLQFYFHTTI